MNPVFNFALLAAASVLAFLLPGPAQAQTPDADIGIVAMHGKGGIPVLYVAPARDYPALAKSRQANFAALPAHELSRLYEPESSHIEAPTAASGKIIRWIGQVAARP